MPLTPAGRISAGTPIRTSYGGPIDPLSAFAFVWATAILFHWLQQPFQFLDMTVQSYFAIVNAAIALAILFRPRSVILLLLLAATQVIHWFADKPIPSNHYIMMMFLDVAVFLAAYVYYYNRDKMGQRQARDLFYDTFASTGRYLLLVMYFYGIFHKINTDFLDPRVSCAVVLYERLTWFVGLDGWGFGRWGAIVATFVIEGVAMVMLFTKRWKAIGFIIGIPFHTLIGFTGYAFYMDFSALVYALYVLFLPREAYGKLNGWVEAFRSARGLSLDRLASLARRGLAVLLAVFGAYTAAVMLTSSGPYYVYYFMPWWAVYSAIFYVVVIRLVVTSRYRPEEHFFAFPRKAFLLLPILFTINGFAPYIGLKTGQAITMFSNLHVEGGETNHLLFPRLPYLFDYTAKPVRVLASNDPELQEYAEKHVEIVEFELARHLDNDPGAFALVEWQGETMTVSRSIEDSYARQPWFLKKILFFKPVDWVRPKACTH